MAIKAGKFIRSAREFKQSVVVATPVLKPYEDAYVASLLTTALVPPKDGITWERIKNLPIDTARNFLVDRFLSYPDKPGYLLFVDTDAGWRPESINKLLAWNKPIVAGTFFNRGFPPYPVAGKLLSTEKDDDNIAYTYDFGSVSKTLFEYFTSKKLTYRQSSVGCFEQEAAQLNEVDAVGMHFTLIRRDVLEVIGAPWFTNSVIGSGEDFDFCRKAKKAGFPIYHDMGCLIGHAEGDIIIGASTFLMTYATIDMENQKVNVMGGKHAVEDKGKLLGEHGDGAPEKQKADVERKTS